MQDYEEETNKPAENLSELKGKLYEMFNAAFDNENLKYNPLSLDGDQQKAFSTIVEGIVSVERELRKQGGKPTRINKSSIGNNNEA